MSGPGDALDVGVVASAPGKLILTGEYAVLDGAPALVIAVDRRVTARLAASGEATGASPFLTAVAEELARRGLAHAATAARRVLVDSTALYEGATKLGLGSSAAVTVAATALALAASAARGGAGLDRAQVLAIAAAAHAAAQGAKGARGSGADIAAATLGGVLEFVVAERGEGAAPRVTRRAWPTGVRLIPFFTGTAADTVTLVAAVTAARARDRVAVDAALAAVTTASRTACAACAAPPALAATALLGALALAAHATDRLAAAHRAHRWSPGVSPPHGPPWQPSGAPPRPRAPAPATSASPCSRSPQMYPKPPGRSSKPGVSPCPCDSTRPAWT